MDKIAKNLIYLYGQEDGEAAFKKVQQMVEKVKPTIPADTTPQFSEKDITLITYADSFYETDKPSLQTLESVLEKYVGDALNTVHILPFSPFSSDRGFSIIDYKAVKKEFGTWDDIQPIARNYRLMADLVLNHVSVKSMWFQKFLEGDPEYQDFFISFAPEELTPELQEDLKKVFRPRSTPILTPYETKNGKRYVWTTFSIGDYDHKSMVWKREDDN